MRWLIGKLLTRVVVAYAAVVTVANAIDVGAKAPPFRLQDAQGATIALESLRGRVVYIDFWASWCAPCRVEHPLLTQLSKDKRIRVVGINYKDQPANAVRFLTQLGNPFAAIGTDGDGRAAIEWGVYGVPETFIVGRDGRIAHKLVGPITNENIASVLMPAIEKALATAPVQAPLQSPLASPK